MNAPVDLTFEDYLAHPALSASGAKRLLKAPALYAHDRANPEPYVPTLNLGRAAHTRVLGVGDPIAVLDYPDYRSREARDARDDVLRNGGTPLLTHEDAVVRDMVGALKANRFARALLAKGDAEQSYLWTDPETGADCKARVDWLTRTSGGQLVIVDYKTAASANPGEFRRSCATYGYHIQDAFHRSGVQAATGEDIGFIFLVQEKTPPYLTSVVELDADAKALGERLTDRARRIYVDCTRTGVWPGYDDRIHPVSLPAWVYTEEDE